MRRAPPALDPGARPLPVLLVEDSALDAELIEAALEAGGLACQVERVATREAYAAALGQGGHSLILSDFSLPGFDGMQALEMARALHPEVPFLFVSGAIGEERAIESLKRGAIDYVLKERLERLAPAVQRALREASQSEQRRRAEEALQFLLEASGRLGSTLELEGLVQAMVALAVPRLADWCAVDALDVEGGMRRMALTHARAERQPLLDVLRRVPTSQRHPILEVVRSRAPRFLPEVHLEELREVVGPAQVAALERLGVRSVMVLPLLGRERMLGTLVLARDAPSAPYGPQDFSLGEDFARRAALAMDNARLYHEAQQAVRLREEMLAIVSHDLRNPLGAVVTSAALLGRRLLAADVRGPEQRYVENIQRASQRMNRLIQDLLDLAAVQGEGKLVLHPEPLALFALVAEALEMLEPLAQEKGIRLEQALDSPHARVLCDRERLLQVFSNLMGNALKFTPEGGWVRVGARLEGGEALLWVRDSGPGIAPEHLPRIFDRFWQAQQQGPPQPRKGIGLGLAIARGIVEAHHGRLWAESLPGEGATFSFTLPLAPAPEGAPPG